jgi:hypothetical protein
MAVSHTLPTQIELAAAEPLRRETYCTQCFPYYKREERFIPPIPKAVSAPQRLRSRPCLAMDQVSGDKKKERAGYTGPLQGATALRQLITG